MLLSSHLSLNIEYHSVKQHGKFRSKILGYRGGLCCMVLVSWVVTEEGFVN